MDSGKPHNRFGTGTALIQIRDMSPDDLEKEAPGLIAKSCAISSKRAEALLANVEDDQKNGVSYYYTGGVPFFPNHKSYNCITWCEAKLAEVKCSLTAKTWHDSIFVTPKSHLLDEEKPKEKQGGGCSIM